MIIGTSVRIVSEMGQFDITLVTSVVRSAFVCFLKQTLFYASSILRNSAALIHKDKRFIKSGLGRYVKALQFLVLHF